MATGWPFWAATSDERIETAFDLAGLQPADHFVDLGCGDGRVLLRAADRGARVTGIEVDDELAAKARLLLADYSFDATVVEGDIAAELRVLAASDPPDVVFAYLEPRHLATTGPRARRDARRNAGRRHGVDRARLGGRGGGRPVLPLSDAADGLCGSWVGRRGRAKPSSSPSPPTPSLVATRFRHPGGPILVAADEKLAGVIDVLAGADRAAPGQLVVLDLRWKPSAPGTVVDGTVGVEGLPPFDVLGIVGVGESGMWGVTGAGMAQLKAVLAARGPAAVLEAARDSRP